MANQSADALGWMVIIKHRWFVARMGLERGSPMPLGKHLRGFAGIRGYGHVVISTLFFVGGGIRLALMGEGEGGTTGVPPDPPGQRIMHGCDGFARRPTTLFPKNITEWRAGAWYAFY